VTRNSLLPLQETHDSPLDRCHRAAEPAHRARRPGLAPGTAVPALTRRLQRLPGVPLAPDLTAQKARIDLCPPSFPNVFRPEGAKQLRMPLSI